jgi:hypothetical protein
VQPESRGGRAESATQADGQHTDHPIEVMGDLIRQRRHYF